MKQAIDRWTTSASVALVFGVLLSCKNKPDAPAQEEPAAAPKSIVASALASASAAAQAASAAAAAAPASANAGAATTSAPPTPSVAPVVKKKHSPLSPPAH